MHANKARDLFSDYREGTLDGGLRQAFERTLRAHPELEREYREFLAVAEVLDKDFHGPVEVPADLHDRIMARIDLAVHESKNRRPQVARLDWRKWGLATAAAAVLGVTFMLTRPPVEGLSAAGVVAPVQRSAPTLDFSGGVLRVEHAYTGTYDVEISQGLAGPVIESVRLSGAKMSKPLLNRAAQATLVRIQVGPAGHNLVVAVPGTGKHDRLEGRGTAADAALAMADLYGVPVQVVGDAEERVTWTLADGNALDSRIRSVDGTRLNAELRESGILVLSH